MRLRSDRTEVAARLRARGWVVVAICAFSAAGEAPRRAQPGIHPLCDMRGLGGCVRKRDRMVERCARLLAPGELQEQRAFGPEEVEIP